MMDMEGQGRRGRGRPKTRWKDCIAADVCRAKDNTHSISIPN